VIRDIRFPPNCHEHIQTATSPTFYLDHWSTRYLSGEFRFGGEYEVALRNHALVRFNPALDPIMRNLPFGWPKTDDFIRASCGGSKRRWDEIDGLPDLEFVGAVYHRGSRVLGPGVHIEYDLGPNCRPHHGVQDLTTGRCYVLGPKMCWFQGAAALAPPAPPRLLTKHLLSHLAVSA
jgi:hypothetical protein